jgi:hypothetical protein
MFLKTFLTLGVPLKIQKNEQDEGRKKGLEGRKEEKMERKFQDLMIATSSRL